MLFRKPKPLSELSYNDIVIKWADELIFNSDHLGNIDISSLMWGTPEKGIWSNNEEGRLRAYVINLLQNNQGNVNRISNGLNQYYEGVKNHVLSHRYIALSPSDPKWILTERGWLVKELGGHFKYQKHRSREINILENQAKINTWLIIATLAAGLIPAILFTIDKIWFHQKPQSKFSVHLRANASNNSGEQLESKSPKQEQSHQEQPKIDSSKTNP